MLVTVITVGSKSMRKGGRLVPGRVNFIQFGGYNRQTAEVLGFDSWQGQEIFIFSTASRPARGPTQFPISWLLGVV
jgi:hypothetical protein